MTPPSAIEGEETGPHDADENSPSADAQLVELPRRRMAPQDRRSMILEQAAEFFASNGPAASTRALAKAIGITQALLYRYFPSKEALVRAVYNERFGQRWEPAWGELLRNRTQSLQRRLEEFFVVYIERLSASDYRLWVRAALEGWSFARFYHSDLVEHVLTPMVEELRHEAGLPDLAARPMKNSELEVAFHLHGALTFLRIRRDVYAAPTPSNIDALVAQCIAVFLPGALQQMRLLARDDHASPLDALPSPPSP